MFLIDYLTTLIKISETWGITASQYVCTLACLWGNHTAAATGNGQGHFPAPPFCHSLCLCSAALLMTGVYLLIQNHRELIHSSCHSATQPNAGDDLTNCLPLNHHKSSQPMEPTNQLSLFRNSVRPLLCFCPFAAASIRQLLRLFSSQQSHWTTTTTVAAGHSFPERTYLISWKHIRKVYGEISASQM